jgi:hypothetical protein
MARAEWDRVGSENYDPISEPCADLLQTRYQNDQYVPRNIMYIEEIFTVIMDGIHFRT